MAKTTKKTDKAKKKSAAPLKTFYFPRAGRAFQGVSIEDATEKCKEFLAK